MQDLENTQYFKVEVEPGKWRKNDPFLKCMKHFLKKAMIR